MSMTPAEELMRGPLMGVFISMLLYGITCIQVFLYFQHHAKDHWGVQTMISVVWILETLHAALSMSVMDHYLVRGFLDLETLLRVDWEITALLAMEFLIAFIVNLYYVWRIKILSSNIWIASFLASIIATRFAVGILICVYCVRYQESYFLVEAKSNSFLIGGMVMIAVGDLLIAGTMAYYLHKARSGVTRSKTDSLVTKLLVYTIGTGALTSLVGFTALIMYLKERNTLYFLGVILVQVKVYTNSVLTLLNVRKYNARLLSYKPSDTFTLTPMGHSQSQRSEEYGRQGEEPSIPRGYTVPMHHPFNPISPSLR